MISNVIIRADDLGYSRAVNYGIADTIEAGTIHNVGLMVNMDASQHGYHLIKNYDLSIGLHTNICVGNPVSNPEEIKSMVHHDGCFISSKEFRNSNSDLISYEDAVKEVDAQYHRFLEIVGRKPDYFEGHAVKSDNFNHALRTVAERYDCKFQELQFSDKVPSEFNGRKMFITLKSSENNYNPFDVFRDMVYTASNNPDEYYLMIFHPGYLDDFILSHSSLTVNRAKEVKLLLSQEFRQFLQDEDIKTVCYKDL